LLADASAAVHITIGSRVMISASMTLDVLESESIEIFREAVAGAERPAAVLDRERLVGAMCRTRVGAARVIDR
jgi:hypothetical protein